MGTILRGRQDVKELEAFINALTHPKGKKVRQDKTIITKEDLQAVLKVISERKTSSPSGLQFVIWKAIGRFPVMSRSKIQINHSCHASKIH